MCKLLRSIIDNDYIADRTIEETITCRQMHCISNVKNPSYSKIGKPVITGFPILEYEGFLTSGYKTRLTLELFA